MFDCLSGKCQLLITTRDANVICGLGATKYELPILEQAKSRALLYQSAKINPNEQLTQTLERIIIELLEQCRGLPLALALVGSNLMDTRVEKEWKNILDDLKNADLKRIRLLFRKVAYPYDNLLAAIEVSYERLNEIEQELFLHFGIFPEDTDIPSDIIDLLWEAIRTQNGETSFENRELHDVLFVLERKSMIQKGTV